MSILSFISDIFKPAVDLVDELHTSEDEKNKFREKIIELQNQVEARFAEAQASIIVAEAKSEHWLTSCWRPIVMLMFASIIFYSYVVVSLFNVPPLVEPDLPAHLWETIKYGLAGYVGLRSVDKNLPKLFEYLTANKSK